MARRRLRAIKSASAVEIVATTGKCAYAIDMESPMKLLLAAALVLFAGACASPGQVSAAAPVDRGAAIAEANCSSCHTVGRSGDSAAPEAPPFRRLSQHYRVADLEEALGEGISVGHPAMPQFAFAPEDVDALILYLDSIQDNATS